jgi:uncharacterized surface protein with fasciclin (FAS1) repeats
MFNVVTRRIAAGALASLLLCGVSKAAMAQDVASTLQSNPEFSDYVSAMKTAGLWRKLEHAKSVTIFAPTNAAFADLRRNWRDPLVALSPEGRCISEDCIVMARAGRQNFLESAGVRGTHPEDQFRGRITMVRSEAGSSFTVDGTQPGKLVINPPPDHTKATIGFVSQEISTVTAGAPIAADNGFIYPTDGFVTTYIGR